MTSVTAKLVEALAKAGIPVESAEYVPEHALLRGNCPNCGKEIRVPLEVATENARTWCSCGAKYPTLTCLTQH